MENSSAMKKAISSPASGLPLSGLKSMRSVSSISLIVSTSPASSLRPASPFLTSIPVVSPNPSRRSVAMSSLSEPLATEAGYCLAKLRKPSIAALRSSKSVADARRPHNVSMVAVAVCNGGVLSMLDECCPGAGLMLSHGPVFTRGRLVGDGRTKATHALSMPGRPSAGCSVYAFMSVVRQTYCD